MLRISDAEVERYLKLFTFLSLKNIQALISDHAVNPSARLAQHTLALELLSLIHGRSTAEATAQDHRKIFTSNASLVPGAALSGPNITLPRSLLPSTSIPKLMFHSGLVESVQEGRRIVHNGGAYIGVLKHTDDGQKVLKFQPLGKLETTENGNTRIVDVSWDDHIINNDSLVLRRGKTDVKVLRFVSDTEYVRSAHEFSGSERWWQEICPISLRERKGE